VHSDHIFEFIVSPAVGKTGVICRSMRQACMCVEKERNHPTTEIEEVKLR
jgi:hypothetical protein